MTSHATYEIVRVLDRIADAFTLPEPIPVPSSHRKTPTQPRRVRRNRKGDRS